MGCAISLAFTERHPDKVKALVLCNRPPRRRSWVVGSGTALWLRERMPTSIGRCTGRSGTQLTNGIGSGRHLFQLAHAAAPLQCPPPPDVFGHMRAPASWSRCSGVLDDLENYSVIDNRRRRGSAHLHDLG